MVGVFFFLFGKFLLVGEGILFFFWGLFIGGVVEEIFFVVGVLRFSKVLVFGIFGFDILMINI